MQAGYEVLNPAVSMKSGLEGRNNRLKGLMEVSA